MRKNQMLNIRFVVAIKIVVISELKNVEHCPEDTKSHKD